MTVDDPFAYVLAQTKANIEFLKSANQITAEDARIILERLPSNAAVAPRDNAADVFAMPMANLSLGPSTPAPEPVKPAANMPPPPSRTPVASASALSRPPPPIPSSFLFKARAMWSYNENGRESDDLVFFEGDVIEVLEDKSADWWKGRVRGKQGLFPASYVQRLPDERPPPPSNAVSSYSPMPPPSTNQYTPHYVAPAPYPTQGPYYPPPQGPPPNGPYATYQGPPPPAPGPVVQQPPPVQEESKKHGFMQGKLGSTLAQSAVGGVGFGAGSAVGSGIINSIF